MQWRNLKVNFAQGTGVTLLLGAMLFSLIYGRLHGTVSPGDFALVMIISLTFLDGVFRVGHEMQRFSKVIGACNQALSFVRLPHAIKDIPGASPIKVTDGEIKFENVSFQYTNNKSLFSDLNLMMEKLCKMDHWRYYFKRHQVIFINCGLAKQKGLLRLMPLLFKIKLARDTVLSQTGIKLIWLRETI